MNRIIMEILGSANILFIIIAGLLIVNKRKSDKIKGIGCYFLCNICSLFMFIFSGLYCFLTSTVIFAVINTINLVRVLKQRGI